MWNHRGNIIRFVSRIYCRCSSFLRNGCFIHPIRISSALITPVETIIQWLESHQFSCFYKTTFGIECPGCGAQRAFIFLLKGEFSESFSTYPPLMLFLFLILFLILHLIFKFKNGGTYLMYSFLFTASVVLINFIYHLISHE